MISNMSYKKIEIITDGLKANLILKQKINNKWVDLLKDEGFIGKYGIGKTKEGDNKTPMGVFNLGIAFGIEDNPGTKLTYIKLNKNMYWVNDSNSIFYNKLVEIIDNNVDKANDLQYIQIYNSEKDWSFAEHLIEENIAYRYAINIDYNKECKKGKGSAIFLHCSKGIPTAGCIAISKERMRKLLINVDKNTMINIYNKIII